MKKWFINADESMFLGNGLFFLDALQLFGYLREMIKTSAFPKSLRFVSSSH